MGGHPADGPGLRPGVVRPVGRPGPLVARTDLPQPPRVRSTVRPRPSRVRRFVRRYGWRAYAVPLLTVATLIAPELGWSDTEAGRQAALYTALVDAERSAPGLPIPELR